MGCSSLIFIAVCMSAPNLPGKAMEAGKVVRVIDGDTVVVHTSTDPSTSNRIVRIIDIDAPELKQPFGTEARSFAERLLLDRKVRIRWHGRDRYGRSLAELFLKNENVGRRLVKAGVAHVYHDSDNREFRLIEARARERRLRLWSVDNPKPPHEFRRQGDVLGQQPLDNR